MPFDGIVLKNICEELNTLLLNGRVDKISQPKNLVLNMLIRANGSNHLLEINVNPVAPRIHIVRNSKPSPIKAPMFCMLLRKHLSSSKIRKINFHDYERILTIEFEAKTELNDITTKTLSIEIMGKHSNIILINSQNKILDAIKHIDQSNNKFREIMPAREYILPPTQDKISAENLVVEDLFNGSDTNDFTISKLLLNKIKGFSPFICENICINSGIQSDYLYKDLTNIQKDSLHHNLNVTIFKISSSEFSSYVYCKDDNSTPIDYYCLDIINTPKIDFPSMNEALDYYYEYFEKDRDIHIIKNNIFKIIKTEIGKCTKKIKIHTKNILQSEKMDEYKLFGELITANLYHIKEGESMISVHNYYSENNEFVEILLDKNLTPQKNSQRYYKLYQKSKSTKMNSQKQLNILNNELLYLENILSHTTNSSNTLELTEIIEELTEEGYIKKINKTSKKSNKKSNKKNDSIQSTPDKIISKDNFEIYIGKNNKQNDYLTLKYASSNDLWFHTKDFPGSHVIIKTNGKDVPETTLIEAASIAAYYSKARNSENVPVDYTLVKFVKKPSKAKSGMVIYTNQKTFFVTPMKNT